MGQWEAVVTGQGHHGPVPFYELWYGLGTGVEVTGTRTEQWRLHMRRPCDQKHVISFHCCTMPIVLISENT